jgi:hypothetical protein
MPAIRWIEFIVLASLLNFSVSMRLLGQTIIPSATVPTNSDSGQSLADYARKIHKEKPPEVRTTEQDANELFKKVDETFDFASRDTGFPRRYNIKRYLVGQADVEKFTRERMAKAENPQRLERTQLTMKKFGFLPRDFNLIEFSVKANVQGVAGYYDEEKKTISLLNWVPIEQQGPILAHELTHALQDQNYDLKRWAKAGQPPATENNGRAEAEMDESVSVRHAVGEGQAMVVYYDYMLAPYGRNLLNSPGVISEMEDPSVKAVIDTEFMHNAPMVLREMGAFPYRDGLLFENELLAKGGKAMAFAGTFARPPRNTHEVLQPKAYIEREKINPVVIPDVQSFVAGKYEIYDSGSVGELDVRALLEQYGERRLAPELAAAWNGGAYIMLKKSGSDGSPTQLADLAFLYVSRWKTPEAAEQFAKIYSASVSKRYRNSSAPQIRACTESACAISSTMVSTEEGPVLVETCSGNTVMISEGFDIQTAAQFRAAVLNEKPSTAHIVPQKEISTRLEDFSAFRDFQANLGARILDQIKRRMHQ